MKLTRRKFVAASALAAASVMVVKPESVKGTSANSKIKLGLIGCGGRGQWITDVFLANPNYEWVAVADYFEDRTKEVGNKLGLGEDRQFTALSGYKRLLDCPLDAVVIETPPCFHPQQAADSVAAGKHVFLSKPIAVDVPGSISVGDSARTATQKKLAFLVDYQARANPFFREAMKRIHRGDMGNLVSVYSYYPASFGGHDTELTGPDSYLRNWYQSLELSGDCIVEQDVHSIDVASWLIGQDPISAIGSGGRKIRKNGDINDHFNILYSFPDGVALQHTSVKFIPSVKDEIFCRAWGTEGTVDTNYFGDVFILGKKPYEGGSSPNNYYDGTLVNVNEFCEAIYAGDFSNPTVSPAVRTNLTAILGRDAARSGEPLTWEEMLRNNVKLEMKLDGLKS